MGRVMREVLGDLFDRKHRALAGLPGVTESRCTTIRHKTEVLELTETFIVQTLRNAEDGDHIFLEFVGKHGSVRLVIPPDVARAIARQRRALSGAIRREHGKRIAKARAAAGIKPGFMNQ